MSHAKGYLEMSFSNLLKEKVMNGGKTLKHRKKR